MKTEMKRKEGRIENLKNINTRAKIKEKKSKDWYKQRESRSQRGFLSCLFIQ